MEESINGKLWFEPVCPHCGKAIDIEQEGGGFYAKCGNCGSEWSTSPLEDLVDEQKWLGKFNIDWKKTEAQKPDPSPTKVLMEIAHSSETLKKAYDLVGQAYDLINKDKVARQYIKFNAEVVWHQFVWDILNQQFKEDNPLNNETYHLRAFNYYGIHPGMNVGESDMTSGN